MFTYSMVVMMVTLAANFASFSAEPGEEKSPSASSSPVEPRQESAMAERRRQVDAVLTRWQGATDTELEEAAVELLELYLSVGEDQRLTAAQRTLLRKRLRARLIRLADSLERKLAGGGIQEGSSAEKPEITRDSQGLFVNPKSATATPPGNTTKGGDVKSVSTSPGPSAKAISERDISASSGGVLHSSLDSSPWDPSSPNDPGGLKTQNLVLPVAPSEVDLNRITDSEAEVISVGDEPSASPQQPREITGLHAQYLASSGTGTGSQHQNAPGSLAEGLRSRLERDGAWGGPFGPPDRAAELIDLIQRVVRPESWEVNGGRGVIRYWPPGQALVVRQTEEVHERVRELLQQLRRLDP